MKDKKHSFIFIRRWLASIAVLAAISVCIVAAIFAEGFSYLVYDDSIVNMNDGWQTDDGEIYSLSDLPIKEITLHHSADEIDLDNMRFCMKSVDTFFEILADGELIYTYRPTQSTLLGSSYGMYIHAVPFPQDTSVLTLDLTPIYPDSPPAILGAVIEDPGMFMCDLFKDGIFGFCICLMMLVLGIIMIISGAFTYRSQNSGHHIEVFTLGVFAVLVAVWSVNDTLLLQILTQSPALIRLLNYLTLIFLPYFIVSFIASATNNHKTPLLPALFVIICINFVLNITLTVTGVSDYFHLVKISQAVIVIALLMAAYFVISAVLHKQVEKRFLRTFLVGLCFISVGSIIDLIRFRSSSNVMQVTSLYARMGSLLFLLLIGMYLIQENRRILLQNSESLELLAYTDGLTGLKNRLAFNKASSSLSGDPDARYMIMQFDINDLKKVNDGYGHTEGDRHIVAAAEIIRSSILDSGDCYRVGGDEFIAIITASDIEQAAQNTIELMESMTEEYNVREDPPMKLDIAYGMADFSASDGDMEKSLRLADRRMYECKRNKKLKRSTEQR